MAFLASPDWPNMSKILSNPIGCEDFIFQVEMLLFFYLNYYFLINKFYFHKKHMAYFVIVLAFYILFIPVTWLLINVFFTNAEIQQVHFFYHHPSFIVHFFNRKLYLFLLILAFSLLIKIWQRLKRIQQENTFTELHFLKSQINPHFLFNTLNSVYSLSLQNSGSTPDAIIKLSSMMRYVLKETKEDYVSLHDELNYISDFVELQKLRLDEFVKFAFIVEGEFSGQKIAPMLLIPFIENAFKYGVNSEEESNIEIKIIFSGEKLNLHVRNSKVKTILSEPPATKLGLSNARKRLYLLYPKTHDLFIEDGEKEFKVNLNLDIR
jgi:LytS/YehU family sensor histidine kinase